MRQFLEDPGEVLERVREQLGADDAADGLETRREELNRRLVAKKAGKNRYVRLYAHGHICEAELETYLLDLKDQTENLRLPDGELETPLRIGGGRTLPEARTKSLPRRRTRGS